MDISYTADRMLRWNPIRKEAWSLTRLAAPLVLSSLVSMGLSITDVIMMKWLGTAALAAGAATSDYYSIIFYLAAGVITAIAAMMSQALGAGNTDEVRQFTFHGFIVAMILAIPGAMLVWNSPLLLALIGVDAAVVKLAHGYAQMMSITFVFMLASVVCHDFLSAHQRTRVILYISAIGLPVNALANYAFMFGNFGMPAMGLAGAGLAPAIVSAMMFTLYVSYIVMKAEFAGYQFLQGGFQLQWHRVRSIFRIGAPIGVSNISEMGVYLLSTVVVGVFGVEALAASALTLRLAGVLYAVPLGLSRAVTVRSGYAAGANDNQAFSNTAISAMMIALTVGVLYLVLVALFRDDLAMAFFAPEETGVIALTIILLGLLALTQPFECFACVSNGLLRGLKDTKIPMIITSTAFWLFGFAGGWTLAFYFKLGAIGLWVGLLSATIAFCAGMAFRFVQVAGHRVRAGINAG